jgi:hypothetical protein
MSLTEHQEQALQQAYRLLGDHFDGALIAVVTEVGNFDGEAKEASRVLWSGGYMQARGLCAEADDRLRASGQAAAEAAT